MLRAFSISSILFPSTFDVGRSMFDVPTPDMQFVRPLPFTKAVEKLGVRSPIGSVLNSSQWRDVPVALRERAFEIDEDLERRYIEAVRDIANNKGA